MIIADSQLLLGKTNKKIQSFLQKKKVHFQPLRLKKNILKA